MTILEINIQRWQEDHWPVVLEESQAGTFLPVRTEGQLKLALEQLLDQRTVLDYGTYLGQALFQDDIRDAFVQARRDSEDELRVLLFVEAEDLQTLHWERLCAPVDRSWNHISLDQRLLFSLYLPSQTDRHFPPIGRRDLRALVLVSNPNNLAEYSLDSFDEATVIDGVKEALGEIPATILSTGDLGEGLPSLQALVEKISREQYTLLHIVAHGQFLRRRGETAVYLTNDEGAVDVVGTTELIDRLRTYTKNTCLVK